MDEQRLEFWHANNGWFLHYDKAHVDEDGRMAVTGPITRPGGIKSVGQIITNLGETRTLTTTQVGLFYEGIGFEEEGSNIILMTNVRTRDIYPSGPGSEAQIQQVMVHLSTSKFGAGRWSVAILGGDSSGMQQQLVDSIELNERVSLVNTVLSLVDFVSVQFFGDAESAAMAVNFTALDFASLGESETR